MCTLRLKCQINLLSKGLNKLADFRAAAVLLIYIFHKYILSQICSFKACHTIFCNAILSQLFLSYAYYCTSALDSLLHWKSQSTYKTSILYQWRATKYQQTAVYYAVCQLEKRGKKFHLKGMSRVELGTQPSNYLTYPCFYGAE